MPKQAKLQVQSVALKDLTRLPGINPNVMSDHDYEALKASIQNNEVGYLQPIVVAEYPDGSHVLVDGEHRVKALIELGYTHADATVGPVSQARLLRLSLHLRGDHDPTLASRELQALVDEGYDPEFLASSTPFPMDELQNLLSLEASSGALLDLTLDVSRGAVSGDSNQIQEGCADEEGGQALPDESTYNLTLRFTAKMDRDRVSQTLRQHGVTHEDGALILLGLK